MVIAYVLLNSIVIDFKGEFFYRWPLNGFRCRSLELNLDSDLRIHRLSQ